MPSKRRVVNSLDNFKDLKKIAYTNRVATIGTYLSLLSYTSLLFSLHNLMLGNFFSFLFFLMPALIFFFAKVLFVYKTMGRVEKLYPEKVKRVKKRTYGK